MAQAIPTYYISYFNLTEELCEMCAVCHRDVEDGGHLFFHCKYVKRVWQALGMEERRVMLEFDSPLMVIVQILQLEERERLKVIIMLRQWWSERNRVREGEKMRSVDDLIYVVEKNAAEFQNFPAVNTRRSVQK